jgi:hypothetical protein
MFLEIYSHFPYEQTHLATVKERKCSLKAEPTLRVAGSGGRTELTMMSDRAKLAAHLHFVDVKYLSLVLLSLLPTVTTAAKSIIKEMYWLFTLHLQCLLL